ncbi:thiamine pyrophosphate-binding protein [Leptospira ilyithenensis]|uniref:Thiamine pyrophosphate-binding protein n=1 Tax=Leptospira ilyithenensis TaxID=2484901 RepID=A0A4R9LMV0_9LEPT|nr:thiamine pyrophosphate-binding protein [Leptospira ilyithenensis]TGN08027.1 thiamine pyrophosphate-binding protein [Leptospira ilyithenensis]
MKRKVSDIVADYLVRRKIRHVFGIVGAGNAHLFDSIGTKGETEIICVHHEQTATMAMQTYFRTSGVVTAAILTTGGGSTNGVTGVVGAWMDSIPGVVISGNENSKFTTDDNPLRAYGVQGYDSVEMVRKVTKYAARSLDPLKVLYELEKAFYIATSGRPGPCWIDIPMNIQSTVVEEGDMVLFDPQEMEGTKFFQTNKTLSSECSGILNSLRNAKRPLLWLGHGIRLASAVDQVPKLLEALNVPALVSWTGIDMIDSDHPLVFGRAGVYGQRSANFVLQNADYILTIGTRLAIPQVGYDITELAREAEIAVVDIDHDELKKYKQRFKTLVQCDAGLFINELLDQVGKEKLPLKKDWLDQCRGFQSKYPWIGPEHNDTDFINSYRFMDKLIGFTKKDQIVVTDMGTALLSGHQVLKFKSGQRLMTSQGLGEMGFGLPGAIGASFARDKGEVLCLNCDGGMMMNLQELQTIVHHKLPIKIIIFNNDGYLMIKHTQNALFSGRKIATDRKSGVSCPDFGSLAKAFGMPSFQIRTWEDMETVIPKFQDLAEPAICEVFMHPEQLFLPKLSLASREDGTLVSPPLEDLSPLLSREELGKTMIIPIHEKSKQLKP